MAVFELPTYEEGHPKYLADDPHQPVRRWWDGLGKAFAEAIDAGYILNLDESMIRWLGQASSCGFDENLPCLQYFPVAQKRASAK